MKKILSIFILLLCSGAASAQQAAPPKPDDNYLRPYYIQKTTLHKMMSKQKNAIVFVGDSITDGNEWSEQLNCDRCQNRGISGDISAGVLARLNDILAEKPSKIFLMIGINDLSRNIPTEQIISNYREFARRTKATSPKTKVYLQSVLPTNSTFRKFADKIDENVKLLNDAMRGIAQTDPSVTYIDLHAPFSDSEGRLDKKYTNDGLHLLGEGYALWIRILNEQGVLK